ncbi:MAG: ABC transporter transmembrane domain-containing protein, partial [Pseudonocardiaceae bacterium]
MSAAAVVRAARGYGMTVHGLRPTPAVLERIPLPAILHWNKSHFVVLERCGTRHVTIIDPAWGRRRLTRDEFAEGVSDVVIALRPGPEFVRTRAAAPSALRTIGGTFLKMPGIRPVIAQMLLATILIQLLSLALPVVTAVLVDRVLGPASMHGMVWGLGGALMIAVAAYGTTSFLRSVLLLYLRGRFDWEMVTGFVRKLFLLPLRFFHQRSTGDIVTRLQSVSAMRDMLTNQSVASILDGGLTLAFLGLMFVFDPYMGLLVLAIVLAQVVLFAGVSGRARDQTARYVGAQVKVNEYVVQAVHGVATVKGTGAEGRVTSELADRVSVWSRIGLQRSFLTSGLETVAATLRLLTPGAVLWIGAFRVLDGSLSIGVLLGMTWLSAAIMAPLSNLLTNAQRLSTTNVELERLTDVLQAEPERAGRVRLPSPDRAGGRIELDSVS